MPGNRSVSAPQVTESSARRRPGRSPCDRNVRCRRWPDQAPGMAKIVREPRSNPRFGGATGGAFIIRRYFGWGLFWLWRQSSSTCCPTTCRGAPTCVERQNCRSRSCRHFAHCPGTL